MTAFLTGLACGALAARLLGWLFAVDHGHDCRCVGEWDAEQAARDAWESEQEAEYERQRAVLAEAGEDFPPF